MHDNITTANRSVSTYIVEKTWGLVPKIGGGTIFQEGDPFLCLFTDKFTWKGIKSCHCHATIFTFRILSLAKQ